MKFSYLKQLSYLDIAFHIVTLIIISIASIDGSYTTNIQTLIAISVFSSLGFIASVSQLKWFLFFFLGGLFLDLIMLRICASTNFSLATEMYFIIFISKILQFFYIAYYNIKHEKDPNITKLSCLAWHLVFIRMYIGLMLVCHCIAKLFLGEQVRSGAVVFFKSLGFSHPVEMVLLAGICEFFGALGLGLGTFTRVSSLATGLFLLIVTITGNHFTLAFSGYEYQLLWCVFAFSFFVSGSQNFSVDGILRYKIENCPKGKNKSKLGKFILNITK